MTIERPPEPWRAFLSALDGLARERIELHCIGGFAVSLRYGLGRPTRDLDVAHVIPNDAAKWLTDVAGRDSDLHARHKVYLQIVSVATLPYHYADRLAEMFTGYCGRLRLLVLDPYDLALSKLPRNLAVDRQDVRYLAKTQQFDLGAFARRYREELRPYVTGAPDTHDLTLKLWIDAIEEERAGQP